MKKSTILLTGFGIALVAGAAIYLSRRNKSNRRHAKISEEGYETAEDILFPGKKRRSSRLHYGPVIPRF